MDRNVENYRQSTFQNINIKDELYLNIITDISRKYKIRNKNVNIKRVQEEKYQQIDNIQNTRRMWFGQEKYEGRRETF